MVSPDYKSLINKESLPSHIAIIMDGNGRWAKKQGGINRIFGHRNGVNAVREATEGCAELGVKYLTLYAFSTENWARPKREVNALMRLLVKTIDEETPKLVKNKVRLNAIGDIESLPSDCRKKLMHAIAQTEGNEGLFLTLALSYSSRWEITEAVKSIARDIEDGKLKSSEVSEASIEGYLTTSNLPDPELLIRTSGEQRISNYLLWQIAYAELYFTETLWPDFNRNELHKAIYEFQHRERRFGKTSAQLEGSVS